MSRSRVMRCAECGFGHIFANFSSSGRAFNNTSDAGEQLQLISTFLGGDITRYP